MKKHNLVLICCSLIVLNSCKKTEAGFTANKTVAYAGESIHFFDNEDQRKNCTFSYDFGDGENSLNNNSNAMYTERNPSHVYLKPGTYEVTQTVTKSENQRKGKSKQKSAWLTVTINPFPVDFTLPETIITTDSTVHLEPSSISEYLYMGEMVSTTGWIFENTTDPTQSNNISVNYPGGNSEKNFITNVRFFSIGVWKITFSAGNGYYITKKTKTIAVTGTSISS